MHNAHPIFQDNKLVKFCALCTEKDGSTQSEQTELVQGSPNVLPASVPLVLSNVFKVHVDFSGPYLLLSNLIMYLLITSLESS